MFFLFRSHLLSIALVVDSMPLVRQKYVFPATFAIFAVIFPMTFICFCAFFPMKFPISLLFLHCPLSVETKKSPAVIFNFAPLRHFRTRQRAGRNGRDLVFLLFSQALGPFFPSASVSCSFFPSEAFFYFFKLQRQGLALCMSPNDIFVHAKGPVALRTCMKHVPTTSGKFSQAKRFFTWNQGDRFLISEIKNLSP